MAIDTGEYKLHVTCPVGKCLLSNPVYNLKIMIFTCIPF